MSSIFSLTLRTASSRNLSPLVQATASLHTSSICESRIKRTHTHKPYFHIKKTAKHPDEPLTRQNRMFIEEMIKQNYAESALGSYVQPEGVELKGASLIRPELQPWARGDWNEYGVRTKRCGILARKIGVVPMWFNNGKRVAATMLQVEDNHVIKYISPEDFSRTMVAEKRALPRIYGKDKPIHLGCLVVGALSTDPQKFTKDYCGLFTASGVMPKKIMVRFPVTSNALIQPGTPLNAAHYHPGQFIDVTARSIRRGFQGVMKRHGFSGQTSDERGNTKSHRAPGFIGKGRRASGVWAGKKMPGHMGGRFVTKCGLQILRINYTHNVLYVLGQAIPGEPGEMVKIFDSNIPSKRLVEAPRYFPTCYPEDFEKIQVEEEYTPGVFKFTDPTITF